MDRRFLFTLVKPLGRVLLLGGSLALGAALWKLTPLKEMVSLQFLERLSSWLSATPSPIVTVVAAFVAASFVLFPVTAMILLSALTLPPAQAATAGVLGVMCSSCTGYALGWVLGPELVERLLGEAFVKVKSLVRKHDLVSVIVIRHLPLGPFTLVNVILGSMHVDFKRFLLANGLSLFPAILVASIVGGNVQRVMNG